MPSVAVCNERGISEHTVAIGADSCSIPLTWGWEYRVVVTAVTAENGNLIGYPGSVNVVGSAMQTDVGHGGFGGLSGLNVFTDKADLGLGTYDFSGSFAGMEAGGWAAPVGTPDPLSFVHLRSEWQVSCNFAVPACSGTVTWRLEVRDASGTLLDPGTLEVDGPPGADGFGLPCVCGPYNSVITDAPSRNQPVRNEVLGTGDGSTTVFTTAFPYVPNSLRAEVAGFVVPIDTTDPASGIFAILGAPPQGELVIASYKAA